MSEAKVALVTGAGRRVGEAMARRLASEGYALAIHYCHSEAGATKVAEEIRSVGGRAELFQADLYVRAEATALVERVVETFGGLDLLVASAANFDRVSLGEIEEEHWDRALDLNLTAPMMMALAAVPTLRARGGNMVFITCASTVAPYRDYLPYIVSKAGLKQLMRGLALELAPEVRVNAVAPGSVLPPEDYSAEALQRLRERSPINALGSAQDVAHAVAYLARASWVTGQELLVDGGAALVANPD